MRCVNERDWTISHREKQIDVSFPCFCPVIDNEFRHNIVKVVCGSTRLLLHEPTATLIERTAFVIER